MCAICSVTQIPICPVGAVCGGNLKEIISIGAVVGATGVGTAQLWIGKLRKKKNNEKK